LVEAAVETSNPDELQEILPRLRAALSEHTRRLRKMAAVKLAAPQRRKTDNTLV
jgi:hypothetical protein